MVIGLISGLIGGVLGLAFTLITLPLRLLGLPLAAGSLTLRIIIRFIARNLFLVLAILAVVFAYRSWNRSSPNLPQLTPAPAAPRAAAPANAPNHIDTVTLQEDGDSNFATDTYAMMNELERKYYSYYFYQAMSTAPDGQAQQWSYFNIAGTLRPNDSFTNKNGVRCRHFNEVLKVHHVQQTISGTACAQEGGGWCKLKPNATPACGLSAPSGGLLNGIGSSLRNLF